MIKFNCSGLVVFARKVHPDQHLPMALTRIVEINSPDRLEEMRRSARLDKPLAVGRTITRTICRKRPRVRETLDSDSVSTLAARSVNGKSPFEPFGILDRSIVRLLRSRFPSAATHPGHSGGCRARNPHRSGSAHFAGQGPSVGSPSGEWRAPDRRGFGSGPVSDSDRPCARPPRRGRGPTCGLLRVAGLATTLPRRGRLLRRRGTLFGGPGGGGLLRRGRALGGWARRRGRAALLPALLAGDVRVGHAAAAAGLVAAAGFLVDRRPGPALGLAPRGRRGSRSSPRCARPSASACRCTWTCRREAWRPPPASRPLASNSQHE